MTHNGSGLGEVAAFETQLFHHAQMFYRSTIVRLTTSPAISLSFMLAAGLLVATKVCTLNSARKFV
jgi:hypothetical protein